MAGKRKNGLNKQTGECGELVMSNNQPVFIPDGQTLEQALERLNKPVEYGQNTPYGEIVCASPDIELTDND